MELWNQSYSWEIKYQEKERQYFIGQIARLERDHGTESDHWLYKLHMAGFQKRLQAVEAKLEDIKTTIAAAEQKKRLAEEA